MSQETKIKDPSKPEMSRLRSIFFPVYAYELKKVVPMGIILFCILAIYTFTRNIKDSQIVTAPGSGSEVLALLKLWCVTPASILFFLLYSKGSNLFNKENIFYATLIPFIAFFGLFALFIYPNREALHMSLETINNLKATYPRFQWFFPLVGNWSYAIFYVLAELWGSALLSLSFWQFANQVTVTKDAKRHYAFFGIIAQFALLFVGVAGKHFSAIDPTGKGDAWGTSLNWLMGIVVALGIFCIGTYRWMHKSVLTDKRFYDEEAMSNRPKKRKAKAGLSESFKTIFTSPYLGLIAMLVIAYGITINVVEGVWKGQMKILYPNPNDFNVFMSDYVFWLGVATIIMYAIGGNLLRMFRWTVCASITPILTLIGGAAFFAFVVFRQELGDFVAQYEFTPVQVAVWLGLGVVTVSKCVKYALFDLTKEMAYIPLDDDMKVKGKAAVDVLGGRLGKSGGALTQFVLLTFVAPASGGLLSVAPHLAVVFLVISVLWIVSVVFLGRRVDAVTAQREAEQRAVQEKKALQEQGAASQASQAARG